MSAEITTKFICNLCSRVEEVSGVGTPRTWWFPIPTELTDAGEVHVCPECIKSISNFHQGMQAEKIGVGGMASTARPKKHIKVTHKHV
jgi:hypothetical protein